MKTGITPTIVVGVCGSRASAAALRWAADEARRRDAHLHVVLCWTAEPRAYYAPARDRHGARGQDYAPNLAATVRRMLDGDAPRGLTTQVVEGGAERALVQESAGADLLVLGSTSSGLAGHSVGPVIRACLGHADCPVVVVGPAAPATTRPEDQYRHRAYRPTAPATSHCRTIPAQCTARRARARTGMQADRGRPRFAPTAGEGYEDDR
jgi:nucleotide-binding universal stress UspA family protein